MNAAHLPLMLMLAGCGSCKESVSDTQDVVIEDDFSGKRNVIVLILDGVRMEESFGDGYSDAAGLNTDEIMPLVRDSLLPQGTLIKPGYSTGITITAPGHCDMITGVRQTFANYPNEEGARAYVPELPTLFEELRAQHDVPAEKVVMASNSMLVTPLRMSLYPGYDDLGAEPVYFYTDGEAISDPKTMLELREVIEERKPRLMFVNLHDIDRAAHYEAVENYGNQAQDLDSVLVNFWDWLSDQPGYGSDTVLVITSDHGRHRDTTVEEFWRGHGDQCSGCREVPMFMVGPGIKADQVIEQPHTLPDLTATLAWLLDTDLPHGEGILMTEVLEEPPEKSPNRDGVVHPAAADGLTAVQRWQSVEPRSIVEIDGTVVSSEGIFAAERPRLFSTDLGTVACWRELSMDPGAEFMPWNGVCQLNDGSGWVDMGFPGIDVSSLWAPTVRQDSEGRLWMAMVNNTSGQVGDDNASDASIWLLVYQPGTASWEFVQTHANGSGLIFPTDVRFLVTDEAFTLAYGTSIGNTNGRNTRRIDVYEFSRLPGPADFEPVLSIAPDFESDFEADLVVAADRLERPVLGYTTGGALSVGFLAYQLDGTINLMAADSEDGESWSTPEVVDDSGEVLAHIDPLWTSADTLLWAELSASDTVEVCSSSLGGSISCTDTGAAYIMGLAEDAGTVTVSVRPDAAADWELVSFSL